MCFRAEKFRIGGRLKTPVQLRKVVNGTEAKATNAATGAVKSDQKLAFNAVGQITTSGYSCDGVGNMAAAPA